MLNVAEKPSVAREVTKILSGGGGFSSRPGFSRFNQVFEFPYRLQGSDITMVFTSVSGHMMELDFDPQFKGWHSCRPDELFAAPVTKRVTDSAADIARTLRREAKECQTLVLWLDCDREGENIAFEVIDVCSAANPRLAVQRAHFSALIPRDIHRACMTLTQPNQHFSMAVDARSEIDLRIGAAFTRFQTLRLQGKFSQLEEVISFGPCQFPTLGFVVERFMKHHSFQPEPFWKIDFSVANASGRAKFTWERVRLFDHVACLTLYQLCVENPTATVIGTEKKDYRKSKPLPLATVEMQKRASRFLRMSSSRTMEVAEGLYQKGFVSYPRTETDSFKEGTDLRSLITAQAGGGGAFAAYASHLLNGGFAQPRVRMLCTRSLFNFTCGPASCVWIYLCVCVFVSRLGGTTTRHTHPSTL